MALKTTDKMKQYRERHKESGGIIINITLKKDIMDSIDSFRELTVLTRNSVIHNILLTWVADSTQATTRYCLKILRELNSIFRKGMS
jgi:hypothetical protein